MILFDWTRSWLHWLNVYGWMGGGVVDWQGYILYL